MSGKYINRLPRGMPADQTRALSDVFQDLHRDATQFQSEFSDGSTRTVRDRLGDTVHLSDFKGTYTEQWQAAVASGASKLYVDSSGTLTSGITIPANMFVWSDGATVTKGANIDMFTLADGAQLINLKLAGSGATYTGRGVVISSGADQHLRNVQITGMAGYCIEYTAVNAGSRSSIIGRFLQRQTATDAAIKLPAGEALTDGTRYFSHIFTGGGNLIDPSGGNMTFISFCNCAGITLTPSTKQFLLSHSRIAGTLILDGGSSPIISGCAIGNSVTVKATCVGAQMSNNNIAGSLTLESGANSCRIDDSNNFQGGVTDNSGSVSNHLVYEQDFTPTWGADGTAPALGNGTLTGRAIRRGKTIRAQIKLTAGSTTTFGTGGWYFQMPSGLNFNVKSDALGSARITDSGTAWYVGIPRSGSGGAPKIYTTINAAGGDLSATVPMTWTTNDVLEIDIEWEIG